jgi:hypothetical protein
MPPIDPTSPAPATGLLAELIELFRPMAPPGFVIGPQTRILADLDLDSLKMLDLIETVPATAPVPQFAAHARDPRRRAARCHG